MNIKEKILQYIPDKPQEDFRSESDKQRYRIEKAFEKAFKNLKGIKEPKESEYKEEEWL